MTETDAQSKPRAFVLISFETEFEAVFRDLVKAPLEDIGFEVERADSQLNQRSILQDIVRGIASADLIVADLTGMNPTVMYELGIAHALEIPTILLTRNIEELPFDLRAYRANEYSIHFSEAPKIQAVLRELGRGRLSGTLAFGSPVTDFLPDEFRREPARERIGSPVAEIAGDSATDEEDEGEADGGAWFDTLAAASDASEQFVEAMNRINQATEAMGARTTERAGRLDKINAGNEPNSVKQASSLFIAFANDLNKYAEVLEAEVPTVEQTASAYLDAMSEYVAWLNANPHLEPGDEVHQLQANVSSLFDATHGSLESTREYRTTIGGLRGVSRPINAASTRTVRALDRLISTMETVESQSSRVLAATEELLQRPKQPAPSKTEDSSDET